MKLHEVCELIVDCPHSTAKDEGNGYALIRTPNIGRGRLELKGVHRVSKDIYDLRNMRAIPQTDDLILAREAPVGNVAKILEGQKVCLGQRTVLIRPDKSKVSPDFLTYYLLAPEQQHNLTSYANGATVAHLNMGNIRNLAINLPTRQVQDRIASILSAYDDMIDNCKRQIALLEEAAQRLYREWFVDMRFPGHETTHFDENGLPEGWKRQRIFPFCNTVLGGTPSRKNPDFWNGNIPWINSGAVNLDRITKGTEYISDLALTKSATKLMPPHTTLLAITGATLGQVSYTEISVCGNQSIIGIIPPSLEYEEYIYLLIANEIDKIISPAGGSAQQHINKDILNNYILTLPPIELTKQFHLIVKPYFDKISTNFKTLDNSKKMRKSLLPRLISGQIEIKA